MKVIYYSGTGNSRYVGKKIAETVGCTYIDLNPLIKKEKDLQIIEEDVILVTPTYAWRIPRIVEYYLEDQDLSKVKRIWFVMTCGDETGNAAKYNRRFCRDIGIEYMGTCQIEMPENYITMFEVPDKEESNRIVDAADMKIREFSETIRVRKKVDDVKASLKDKIKSRNVNPIFYKLYVKAKDFYAKDSCIGCGICESMCPLNNIRLKNGKPVWGEVCTHCMACICYCPREAIEYGKASQGKFRYHIEALNRR